MYICSIGSSLISVPFEYDASRDRRGRDSPRFKPIATVFFLDTQPADE